MGIYICWIRGENRHSECSKCDEMIFHFIAYLVYFSGEWNSRLCHNFHDDRKLSHDCLVSLIVAALQAAVIEVLLHVFMEHFPCLFPF